MPCFGTLHEPDGGSWRAADGISSGDVYAVVGAGRLVLPLWPLDPLCRSLELPGTTKGPPVLGGPDVEPGPRRWFHLLELMLLIKTTMLRFEL